MLQQLNHENCATLLVEEGQKMWLKAVKRLTWTRCFGQLAVSNVELEKHAQLNICCFVLQ